MKEGLYFGTELPPSHPLVKAAIPMHGNEEQEGRGQEGSGVMSPPGPFPPSHRLQLVP